MLVATVIDEVGRHAGQEGVTRLGIEKAILNKDLARAIAGAGLVRLCEKRGRWWRVGKGFEMVGGRALRIKDLDSPLSAWAVAYLDASRRGADHTANHQEAGRGDRRKGETHRAGAGDAGRWTKAVSWDARSVRSACVRSVSCIPAS